MKELDLEFEGGGEMIGFIFKQFHATGRAYIYEVTCTETNVTHYEVFERVEYPEADYEIAGSKVHKEAQVGYPKSNHFGDWAYCVTSKKRAFEKLSEVEDRMTQRELNKESEKVS